jgi:hypothetical protein
MGITFWRSLLFVSASIIACSNMPAWAAGEMVAMVSALRGTATGQPGDGGAATPLAVGSGVHQGDVVRTGPDSRMKLLLSDTSTLSLGADTELKLDNLALRPGAREGATTLTQFGGYVRAVISPVAATTRFEIHTPSMVAAVRGTDWIQNYSSGETQIFVARGRVLASGTGSYAGDRFLLTAGEGVTFSDNKTHTPVVRWKKPKIDLFVAATRVR